MPLYLDFHDHSIEVQTTLEGLLEKLRREFHFFISEDSSEMKASVELNLETPPPIPQLVAHKVLEHAIVFELGELQYVDYFGEALAIWDTRINKVSIFTTNEDRLYELGFLAIHSLLGQLLDRQSICRVHALGVSLHKTNAVVMLPSKGGKSTLLTYLLENPEIKVIADDMPLIDHEGRVHPFPSKISLDKKPDTGALSSLSWHEFNRAHYPLKFTASLAEMKERISLRSYDNRTLLIAGFRLSTGESILTEVSKWKMVSPILEHMVVGLGLPQVVELFLRFRLSDLLKMAKHFFIRSFCAFQLIRRSKCYHFYLGPDKAYNAQLLLESLYEHEAP